VLPRRQLLRFAFASGLAGMGGRAARGQAVRDAVSVRQFGARGDGVSDDSAAFRAAIDSGARRILVPRTTTAYLLRATLAPQNGQEIAGEDGIALLVFALRDGAAGFALAGCQRVRLADLAIRSAGPASTLHGIDINASNECTIARVEVVELGGLGVRLRDSRTITVEDSVFRDGRNTAIEISGARSAENSVLRCVFARNRGFGCRLTDGAYNNLVSECATRERNGIELVGITYDSYANVVTRNHALACGDNGISVTGHSNVISGNLCERNAFHGIGIYGSSNLILNNQATNNGQASRANNLTYAGFSVIPGWGGLGRSNYFLNNTARDDQPVKTHSYGYKVTPTSYAAWRSDADVTQRQFVVSGASIYVSTSAGRSGSRAPTHRAGTASDGGVTWLHVATVESFDATDNTFMSNTSTGQRLAVYDLRGNGVQRVDGRASR
jgi:parallel beta-helix repeat protein